MEVETLTLVLALQKIFYFCWFKQIKIWLEKYPTNYSLVFDLWFKIVKK